MLKVPSYCSFRLDLHELWSKEGAGGGVKWGLIGMCYTPLERYFQGLKDIALEFSKQIWFEKNMGVQSFGTTKVLVLGLPLGSLGEKWHLHVVLAEKHKIYYREGSGASSQRLQAV